MRRMALVLPVLAALLATGCSGAAQPKPVTVPAPGTMAWPQWWKQVAAKAGVKPDEPLVRVFWLQYDAQGQVAQWKVDLARSYRGHLELIGLSGQGNKMEVYRNLVDGRAEGLDAPSFWYNVTLLPAGAWPAQGGQVQLSLGQQTVAYDASQYAVFHRENGAWVTIPPGSSYITQGGDWEARQINTKNVPVAFWLWYPEPQP
jgi:hypothetical protein